MDIEDSAKHTRLGLVVLVVYMHFGDLTTSVINIFLIISYRSRELPYSHQMQQLPLNVLEIVSPSHC